MERKITTNNIMNRQHIIKQIKTKHNMKTKIIPFLLLSMIASGAFASNNIVGGMPEPESWPTGLSDGEITPNRYHSVWVSEMLGEDPNVMITKGGVFDYPPALIEISNRIEAANERGMSHIEFNAMIHELTNFIQENPRYRKQAYIELGNIYNYVRPVNLRNTDRAFQFYSLALPLANSNSDKSQINLLMASCFNNIDNGSGNISELTNYLMKAAEIDGRYSSGIGDIVMCGWGNFCDMYLAASFYTIGMMNGDAGSGAKLNILNYIIEKPNWSINDSLGFYDFERFLYHSRLTNDKERAFAALISSCQRDFVPAYYYAAYNYMNNQPNISQEERRKKMYQWLSKGSQANYAPCVYGLGMLASVYTIDTAKGDIYKPNAEGKYSESERKSCAKQAYELFQRAANMGNANAIMALAELYQKGNEYGYPKKDVEKALYYYILSTHFGNDVGFKRIDEMRAVAGDKEDFERKLAAAESKSKSLHIKFDTQLQQTFEKILNNDHFNNPRMVASSYNMAHPDIDISNNTDQLLLSMLARNYNNVYKLYIDKIARLARWGNSYVSNHITFYQERMREIRLRYQSQNLPKEIRESMWESWNGN